MRSEQEVTELVARLEANNESLEEKLSNPTGGYDFDSLVITFDHNGILLSALKWVLGEETIRLESDAEREAKDATQSEALRQAQLVETERLLAKMPENDFLGRISLEGMRDKLRAQAPRLIDEAANLEAEEQNLLAEVGYGNSGTDFGPDTSEREDLRDVERNF